ncbi:MAG: alpha-galactosidase [Clostridia bacterium]|nr:alpha-galactosidase [Clostridia bacterium]
MKFSDIYYTPGPEPVFCYRSGAAVYEERFFRGALVACGWNTAGYPLDTLSLPNNHTRIDFTEYSIPQSFSLTACGICLDFGWKFAGFEKTGKENRITGEIRLESSLLPVTAYVRTVIDGTGAFTRNIEIENTGTEYIPLSRIVLMGGALETMRGLNRFPEIDTSDIYTLGYFRESGWGREGSYAESPLTEGVHAVDCRFGRDRHRHPVLFIKNEAGGDIYEIQVGYSAGVRFTVDYDASSGSDRTRLAFGAEVTGYAPLLVLRPGERFCLPETHIAAVHGGLDDAVNAMNAHIRRSVLTMPGAEDTACLVGSGMGAEHDMLPDTTKAYMDQLAAMGAEVFIIDAGWACPPEEPIDWGGCNGRNTPDPDRYPGDSFRELRDYCHSKGMKFGLWVEIERIGRRSGVFADHPEWRGVDRFGNRSDQFLDLTVPEAFDWAYSECARIIEEYGVGLFRVDYNIGADEYYKFRDTDSCGIAECTALRHYAAVYELYRRLHERFPDVIFENCAGGGGRTDLGMLKAFNHTWVSDWQISPRSVAITNGMTLALPPERVDRLFAGMGCHEYGGLDLHIRNTMLTHMSLNVISPKNAELNADSTAFVRRSVDIYKNFIRPFLPEALVYHHTPEAYAKTGGGFSALETASPDKRRGACAVFALQKPVTGEYRLYPKGIDPSLEYTVTLDNYGAGFKMSGFALMNDGIKIRIPSALSSELVLYES